MLLPFGCSSGAAGPLGRSGEDGISRGSSTSSSDGGSDADPKPSAGADAHAGSHAGSRPTSSGGVGSETPTVDPSSGGASPSERGGTAGSEASVAGADGIAGGTGGESAAGGTSALGGVPSGGASGGHAGTPANGGSAGNPTSTVKTLPCDVRAVLQQRCQTCHQDPPLNDAPMPLLTWYDVSNKATDMQDKLDMDEMPPGGEPDLSERQLSTLLNYLAQGTPPAGNVSCR